LLAFFKALADANRLKIVGLLAGGDYTVEQLAAMLDLRASTVSHHLARLAAIGLVSARAESYYNIYSLRTDALEAMAARLLSVETLAAAASDTDRSAYDRDVLKNYVQPDGSLKQIPSQRKKLEVILRYVLEAFEPGREYTEREVNAIIGRYHENIAGLRRDLVDFRMLVRDKRGTTYRRTNG
jgi:hypothetical protein